MIFWPWGVALILSGYITGFIHGSLILAYWKEQRQKKRDRANKPGAASE